MQFVQNVHTKISEPAQALYHLLLDNGAWHYRRLHKRRLKSFGASKEVLYRLTCSTIQSVLQCGGSSLIQWPLSPTGTR